MGMGARDQHTTTNNIAKRAWGNIKDFGNQLVGNYQDHSGFLEKDENGKPAGFKDRTCFVAGTKVKTKDGLKNIEDIQVGDVVLSKSDVTGEAVFKQVVNTFVRRTQSIYKISFEDGTFLETTIADREEIVYNFEVEDFHTYFVGEVGVWVHNDSCNNLFGGKFSDLKEVDIANARKKSKLDGFVPSFCLEDAFNGNEIFSQSKRKQGYSEDNPVRLDVSKPFVDNELSIQIKSNEKKGGSNVIVYYNQKGDLIINTKGAKLPTKIFLGDCIEMNDKPNQIINLTGKVEEEKNKNRPGIIDKFLKIPGRDKEIKIEPVKGGVTG